MKRHEKYKYTLLWHESSNILAIADLERGQSLPVLNIVDEDYSGINPFYAYPIDFLVTYYGWVVLGELK